MPQTPLFLLVEDNADDILLVQRAFAKAQILNPLQIVRSGEEAIQYLSGEGPYAQRAEFPLPSVVLLDLKLVGRDGFDVLQWLRSQPTLGNLRVIVLTSSDSIYDVDRAYKLGANSFLIKPVIFEDLVELMHTIRGYWMWHDTPPSASRPENHPAESTPAVAANGS